MGKGCNQQQCNTEIIISTWHDMFVMIINN